MAGKAKTQQKRWHLDGGIEVTNIQNENDDRRPSTFLGNYNGDNAQSLALVAYTGSYYDLVDYPDLKSYVVDGNYVHTDNNFTSDEKAKLANLFNYTLPVATEKRLGGVKVGDHLEMRIDPKIKDPKQRMNAVKDRISVIESHFIYIQDANNVTRFSQIPTNSAGQMTLAPIYTPEKWNPTHELSEEELNDIKPETGNYIRYNDMAFFSQDPDVETKEYNGKTMKVDQDYMAKGGLWWTTTKANRWIRVLDQFNIISFNNRVGKVVPVGMDDYKVDAEDYTADMVGAIARRGVGGVWTEFENKAGRVVLSLFNGSSLEGLEDNSAGWARIGCLGWDEDNQVTKPDPINSPTGGIITGVYWKYTGLPTLPPIYETTKTGAKRLVQPATYRGINNTSIFFMPDGQDRIWVKRSTGKFDDNEWFYLEQLPIATRTRLGGVKVGDGLDITEDGVLYVSGFVTSWTGKQGDRRINDVVAINGDYDAKMITFGSEWSNTNNVDYELKRLQQVLNTKAPIVSPEFTGRPIAPTPGANDNGKQIVNIEWVRRHVATELQNVVGYTLPPATTSTLGGIIVGNGLSISAAGVLSVNIPSGGGGSVVVDTSPSTTSSNPIANYAITQYVNTVDNKLGDYVLKVNGTAQNLTLTGNAKYVTLPKGTSNDFLATTKFVMDAIGDAIQVIGGGSGGGVVINPYTLPPASATVRGGVRVTGNDGIKLSNTDVIGIDKDYLQGGATYASGGKLDYITAKENITGGTFADIPMNSSGVTRLIAAYSPTANDMQGYYIKYNAGDNPDSYIMWFCDFDTNNSYYLVYKNASEYAWSMTFAVEGMDNYQDFDIRLYAKLDSPQFTGLPTVPDADTWDDNSSQIANTRFVNTFVNRKIQNQQKAGYGNQFGVVAVKQNGGIKVQGGVIEMDGVVSFKNRKGAITPQLGDYTSSLINNASGISGSTVTDALNNIKSNYAPLNSPAFTGVPTIGTGQTKSPIATEYYVRQWKPIAKKAGSGTANVGMVQIGDGLDIDTNGVLSVVGSVTGWTGNQGTRQTGEVIAIAGDYNANMIYYEPQDASKTVRSELDLKAYDDQVIHRNDGSLSVFGYTAGAMTRGDVGDVSYVCLPTKTDIPAGTSGNLAGDISKIKTLLLIKPSLLNNKPDTEAYILSQYLSTSQTSGQKLVNWASPRRILTTNDLVSTAFTGTPTINGNQIATVSVAGTNLGLVKNGGNVVIDVDGKMDYTLPTASSSILGGVKIGSGFSIDSDGTISTSGSVTTWNSRAGDVVPASGDYDASQITYNLISNVSDELDGILNGSKLPIATKTSLGAIMIGDGISIDQSGKIDAFGKHTLEVSSLNDVPVNSAGMIVYNGTSPASKSGSYICLYVSSEGSSPKQVVYLTESDNKKKIYHGANTFNSARIYASYRYGTGSNILWTEWEPVDCQIFDIDNFDYGLSDIIYSRYRQVGTAANGQGIFQWTDWNARSTANTSGVVGTVFNGQRAIASYFNVGYEFVNTSEYSNYKYMKLRFPLTIASFTTKGNGTGREAYNSDSQIPGLYYSRGSTDNWWIKLIDSQNISDYIPDTSSFYNTENYTTTEISDEITATLAELNA